MISKKVSAILVGILSAILIVFLLVMKYYKYIYAPTYGLFVYIASLLIIYFLVTWKKQNFLVIAGTVAVLGLTTSGTYYVALALNGGDITKSLVGTVGLIMGIIFYSIIFISTILWFSLRKKNPDFFKLTKERWITLLKISLVLTFGAPIGLTILMMLARLTIILFLSLLTIMFIVIVFLVFNFYVFA